jgi:hypothetical protein
VSGLARAQGRPYGAPGMAQPVRPLRPAAAPVAPSTAGALAFTTRFRYEGVDQSSLPEDADAATLRTRIGYTTPRWGGLRAMVEGEHIVIVGPPDRFNAAGASGPATRPVVADPETVELNQAWLSYGEGSRATLRAGRQRLILENHRFVGDVGWRQNMQTFDAFVAETRPTKDLAVTYGYVWGVNRIFGDVRTLPAASPNRDFDSRSHLLHATYTGLKSARVIGYSYLLDLQQAAGNANSVATVGAAIAGTRSLDPRTMVGYRGEFAHQTDYADSPYRFATTYGSLEGSATIDRWSAGVGTERLGSGRDALGGGRVGFRTPLSTAHAFNGWADAFLNTPAEGLDDRYGFVQVMLPHNIPLRVIHHRFRTATDGAALGSETDLIATWQFGAHWAFLAKFAAYHGVRAPAAYDSRKAWLQFDLTF